MKILAIDYGLHKIGLAISDELGIIAAPLPTLRVKSQAEAIEGIKFVINDVKAEAILIGLPSGYGNEDSEQTKVVKRFSEKLKLEIDLKITFWDESYSTKQAEKGAHGRKRANSDSEAARIILQEYLNYLGESKFVTRNS